MLENKNIISCKRFFEELVFFLYGLQGFYIIAHIPDQGEMGNGWNEVAGIYNRPVLIFNKRDHKSWCVTITDP